MGFKRGHTDYRISAIPLGAYVKLYGDEATGPLEGKDDTTERVPESELLRASPTLAKIPVMIGGPFMNLVLAFSIPFGMALIQGIPSVPAPVIDRSPRCGSRRPVFRSATALSFIQRRRKSDLA